MRDAGQGHLAFSASLIESALTPYGIKLTRELIAQISAYAGILAAWNRKVSLTSLHDPVEILKTHFGESLFAAHILPTTQGRLADVGSGAGFPGLALKLYCPMLDLTLIEANGKKAVFLSEVIRTLQIKGARVLRRRMEEGCVEEGQLDLIASRAMGRFDKLLSWSATALGNKGAVVLWVAGTQARDILADQGWKWRVPVKVPESRERYVLVGERS